MVRTGQRPGDPRDSINRHNLFLIFLFFSTPLGATISWTLSPIRASPSQSVAQPGKMDAKTQFKDKKELVKALSELKEEPIFIGTSSPPPPYHSITFNGDACSVIISLSSKGIGHS
jgi:hypothetical protein